MRTEQLKAVSKLKKGLAFHDSFGTESDDSQIYINGAENTLFELDTDEGLFKLGDLRDILSFFIEQGYI